MARRERPLPFSRDESEPPRKPEMSDSFNGQSNEADDEKLRVQQHAESARHS